MTEKQLHILRHSLGLDDSGNGREYRNHFATGPGTDDFDDCVELCGAGFMRDPGKISAWGDMHCFTVTGEGVDEVRRMKPPKPKLSKSAERYRLFLAMDSGMSFREFLKSKWSRPNPVE